MIKLWFKIAPAGLVVVIGSVFLNNSLEAHPGYRAFVAAAARTGWVILIGAVVVLVADFAAVSVYMIRKGKTDDQEGAVVTGGALPMSFNPTPAIGRSKRKVLTSKSKFVSVESLVDGSATFGDRMMVLGICIALLSFFSIFLGAGLMLMHNFVVLALFPVVPGVLLFKGGRSAWADYREAKAKVQARPAAHGPAAASS